MLRETDLLYLVKTTNKEYLLCAQWIILGVFFLYQTQNFGSHVALT